MEVKFNQHIGIFPEAIPTSICNKCIDLFESEDSKKHQYDRQDKRGYYQPFEAQDTFFFLTDVNVSLQQKLSTFFWKELYPIYAKKYTLFNLPIYLTGYKIQKTLPSQGYHKWHCENLGLDVSKRLMVYTLYLNDVKEGGETEFLHQSFRLPPKTGTFSMFPAGYTHFHRGNPPLKGVKYIITGWIELLKLPPNPSSTNLEELKTLNPLLQTSEQINPDSFLNNGN
tara:strand:- start:190 stop:867 length:678 start_codon:yes stop_codon:yes gene_type:complete